MASNSVEIIGLLSENNLKGGSYEKNGKKNYSTNVVVESFRLLDA